MVIELNKIKKNYKRNQEINKLKKLKLKKLKLNGIITITSTFNNTTITASKPCGKILGWISVNQFRAKSVKRSKSLRFLTKEISEVFGKELFDLNIRNIVIHLKGLGRFKNIAVRGLKSSGLKIFLIRDIINLPHNGCRLRKYRRK